MYFSCWDGRCLSECGPTLTFFQMIFINSLCSLWPALSSLCLDHVNMQHLHAEDVFAPGVNLALVLLRAVDLGGEKGSIQKGFFSREESLGSLKPLCSLEFLGSGQILLCSGSLEDL